MQPHRMRADKVWRQPQLPAFPASKPRPVFMPCRRRIPGYARCGSGRPASCTGSSGPGLAAPQLIPPRQSGAMMRNTVPSATSRASPGAQTKLHRSSSIRARVVTRAVLLPARTRCSSWYRCSGVNRPVLPGHTTTSLQMRSSHICCSANLRN